MAGIFKSHIFLFDSIRSLKKLSLLSQVFIAITYCDVFITIKILKYFQLNGGCLIQSEHLTYVLDNEDNYTHLFLPSAIFNCLGSRDLQRVSKITDHLIVGGETPSTQSLGECLRNGLKITQIYGPTETTVWSLWQRVGAHDGSIIGKSFFNGIFLE